jgi:hypothetical protein
MNKIKQVTSIGKVEAGAESNSFASATLEICSSSSVADHKLYEEHVVPLDCVHPCFDHL